MSLRASLSWAIRRYVERAVEIGVFDDPVAAAEAYEELRGATHVVRAIENPVDVCWMMGKV